MGMGSSSEEEAHGSAFQGRGRIGYDDYYPEESGEDEDEDVIAIGGQPRTRVVPYKVDEGPKLDPVELFVSSFLSSGFWEKRRSFLKRCSTLFTVDRERRKISQIWCVRFSS
jgi:hypothetical protein